MIHALIHKKFFERPSRLNKAHILGLLLVLSCFASPSIQSEPKESVMSPLMQTLTIETTGGSKIQELMSAESDLIAFKQTNKISHLFGSDEIPSHVFSFDKAPMERLLPLTDFEKLKEIESNPTTINQLLAISDRWSLQQFKLTQREQTGLTVPNDTPVRLIADILSHGENRRQQWFWVDLAKLRDLSSDTLEIADLRSMIPTQETIQALGLAFKGQEQPKLNGEPRTFKGSLGQLSRIEVTQTTSQDKPKEPKTLDELSDAIFDDPTNLELNLKLFQAQIAVGELEAAETTLDRVLILDPRSRYAKILLAETKINLGKLTSARAVLNQLLTDDDLPQATRDRATELTAQIDQQLDPTTLTTSVTMGVGITKNALGKTKTGTLEGLLPGTNLYVEYDQIANEENRSFNDLAVSTKWVYQLPTLVPQVLSINGGVTRRDYIDTQMSDVTTWSVSGAHQSQADRWLINSSLTGSALEVNDYLYSHTGSLNWSGLTRLTETTNLGANVGYTRSYSSNYPGIANNPDKSSETASMGLSLSGAYEGTGWSISGSLSDTNTRDPQYSSDTKSLGLSLSRAFGLCTLTNSVMQSWNNAKRPQLAVSTERKQTTSTQTNLSLTCLVPNVLGGASMAPFIKASKSESRSNISNNSKDGSEFSMGVKVDY